jgi:hypothetical protein
MNLVLLMVVVAEACIGVCAWLSPEWLRRVATRLLTRADLIEITRKEEQRRMQFWSAEIGLSDRSSASGGPAAVARHRAA